MDKLPALLDLSGTFVFALSGALAGARRELDFFGVLVLSFAAGNSGGITRDLLIGAVPPRGGRRLALSRRVAPGRHHHLLLLAPHRADVESDPHFRCGGTRALRRYGLFEGIGPRTESRDGDGTRDGDRHRRRYGARRAAGRNSHGAARGTLCRRRIGRFSNRGDRPHATASRRRGHGGRADFMLPTSRHGDQARLAASGREDQGTRRSKYREEEFEGQRTILDLALPLRTDIRWSAACPKRANNGRQGTLFDHLAGAGEEHRRNG
jgi:Glycine transporter